MTVHSGRHGAVYLSTTGTGTASQVLKLSSWSLDHSTDMIEVTSFGDVNKTYVQGLPDITGEFEGFWDDAETKIFVASDSTDGAKLYLYMDSDTPTQYFYGPAWVNFSMETGVADAVKVSGEFSANGAWGRKP